MAQKAAEESIVLLKNDGILPLKKGVKAFCAAENRKVRNLLSAALGSFSGILLISIAEYTWFYPRNMFVFYFLFGIIAACIKLTKLEK